MKNKHKKLVIVDTNDRGFGLIEVIVGLTMLVLTATAALALSRTSIKAESFNAQRVVAYNLAQQVMEETRRQRDSAWDDLNPETRWLIGTDALIKSLDNYVSTGGSCVGSDEEVGYPVKCTLKTNDVYYIKTDVTNVNDISTLHGASGDGYGFYEERGATDISSELAKRVYIDVMWSERGSKRHFELISLLTDWKPAI